MSSSRVVNSWWQIKFASLACRYTSLSERQLPAVCEIVQICGEVTAAVKTNWQQKLHRSRGGPVEARRRVRSVLTAFPDVSFKQTDDGIFTAIRGSFDSVVEVVGALRKLTEEWSECEADVDASDETEKRTDAVESATGDAAVGKPSPNHSRDEHVDGDPRANNAAQSAKIFSVVIDVEEHIWSYVEKIHRDELQRFGKDVTIRQQEPCKIQLNSTSKAKLDEVNEALAGLLEETHEQDIVSWPILLKVGADSTTSIVQDLLRASAVVCQGVMKSIASDDLVPTAETDCSDDRQLCKYDVIAPRAVMCRVLPLLIDSIAQRTPRVAAESASTGRSWWQILSGISKSSGSATGDSTFIKLYNFHTSCGLSVYIGRGSFSFLYLFENLQLASFALSFVLIISSYVRNISGSGSVLTSAMKVV